MVQAARSGKQNIAEASAASGTSKKIELTLTNVARASLEELLLDYQDYLRQNGLEQWSKDHEKAKFIRNLRRRREAVVNEFERRRHETYGTHGPDETLEGAQSGDVRLSHSSHVSHQSQAIEAQFAKALYEIYRPYIEVKGPENAANTLICLIHQTKYLLDRLLTAQENQFKEQGGFAERMYNARKEHRKNP
jgi:four helix bundle suffix protein